MVSLHNKPLLKPDKPAATVNSNRFVRLTSCIGKLFERLITNRLSWFVEKNNIIGPEQAGFRKHRSTTDHVIILDHDIKASFKHKKYTVAVTSAKPTTPSGLKAYYTNFQGLGSMAPA